MNQKEQLFMKEALKEAKKAYEIDEVPIGAVIVFEDTIIGRGYNRRNTEKNVLAHAEITAINQACKYIGDWRLENCDLYVTLEPCPMCAGAIVQARMGRVVLGARNPKAGCAGSIVNLLQESRFNHQVEIIEEVCTDECSEILKKFFRNMRNKSKKMVVDS